MNARFACGLITLLGVLTLQPTAYATFHMMQIEQVIGSVDGDTTAQAIQLRIDDLGVVPGALQQSLGVAVLERQMRFAAAKINAAVEAPGRINE